MQATDQIVLNALDLQLDSVTVKGDKELKPEVQLCAEEEVARFKFNTTLQPAEYDLDIIFKVRDKHF